MEQLLERYEQEAKQMTVMLPRERAENMLGNIEQLQAKLQQAKNDIQNLMQEKLIFRACPCFTFGRHRIENWV